VLYAFPIPISNESHVLLLLQEYEDVVNEDYYELVQIFHKHLVHEAHEVGRCFRQSKGHDCVLVQSISCMESCLGYV
jgi:hypothetical protein